MRAGCSGDLLPPSPPAEKATSCCHYEAWEASTDDRSWYWSGRCIERRDDYCARLVAHPATGSRAHVDHKRNIVGRPRRDRGERWERVSGRVEVLRAEQRAAARDGLTGSDGHSAAFTSTSLSALVTDRAMEAWYHLSIA